MKIILEVLAIVVAAPVIYAISASIHELGHLVLGWAQGFKFYLFVVGPLGIKRNHDGKIVIYLEKDVAFWGGISATIPINEDSYNIKRFSKVLLGGPIFSLIWGMIFLPIGLYTMNIFLILLGAMPISMGLVCIIPMRAGGCFFTDGGRWLRLKKKETQYIEYALWNIVQEVIVRGSYSKINFSNIQCLIDSEDIRTKYMGNYYAYLYYKDSDEKDNFIIYENTLKMLQVSVPKQMVRMFPVV